MFTLLHRRGAWGAGSSGGGGAAQAPFTQRSFGTLPMKPVSYGSDALSQPMMQPASLSSLLSGGRNGPMGYRPSEALPSATQPLALALQSVPTALVAGLSAIVAVGVAATLLAWLDAWLRTKAPVVIAQSTPFNDAVLPHCPTLVKPYAPTPFLTNCHVETIFAAKTRRGLGLTYRRECLIMSDGGCVALDWEHHEVEGLEVDELPDDAPVLILFPGLTGGSGDSYVEYAVRGAAKRGLRAVVFNSRGTAFSPVTSPQFYSASFTGDTRAVIAHVAECYPESVLMAAGWSLGANILVRYLGEQGSDTPLVAAVSLCNPFNLTISNAALKSGFSQVYDGNLATALRGIFNRHRAVWAGAGKARRRGSNGGGGAGAGNGVRPDMVDSARTIDDFDEAITRHSFGWDSVEQYYARSGSCLSIPYVSIPLLCIQALDDPIAPQAAIPYEALAANPHCVLVTTDHGGHLGWVAGPGGLFGRPWSDDATLEWLSSALNALTEGEPGRFLVEEEAPLLVPAVAAQVAAAQLALGSVAAAAQAGQAAPAALPLAGAPLSTAASSASGSRPAAAASAALPCAPAPTAATLSPAAGSAALTDAAATATPTGGRDRFRDSGQDTIVGPATAPGMILGEQVPVGRWWGSRPPRPGAVSPPSRLRSVSPTLRGSRAGSPDRWGEAQLDSIRFG